MRKWDNALAFLRASPAEIRIMTIKDHPTIQNQTAPSAKPASLANFFSRTSSTDLNSCDLEQVHLLGEIQHEGAMLVVSQDEQKIVAISSNVVELFGFDSGDLHSASLTDFHTELSESLKELDVGESGIHSVLDLQFSHYGQHYDAVAHGHKGNWVIELIPNNHQHDALVMRKHIRTMTQASGRILSMESLDDAMQLACDATRQITGFARVQIFQFLPDWSGKVIADSRAEHMSSFVGLHFPATDIPKQARALMQMVPYRTVFSVNDATLDLQQNPLFGQDTVDLTYALTRSCSTMHTAYLRNMGVQATFTISLMQGDKLWGFIACHHDHANALPFDVWSLLRELGTTLVSRIGYEDARTTSIKVLELRKLEVDLASRLRAKGNLVEVVDEFGPALMRFMNADGFAFRFGNQFHVTGQTPSQEFITQFIDWAQSHSPLSGQFNTSALHKEWPEAKNFTDSACGVLLQPVATHRVCQMIWFRQPLSDSVEWAGEPLDKSVASSDQGEMAKLLPRNSFSTWIGEHNDFSLPWSDAELNVAQEILRELLDILASVLVLTEENTRMALSEENTQLKSFAASAAVHDIKAPLRRIELALEIMEEDGFDPEAIRMGHEIASKSASVLKNVSAGILEFMGVPDKAHAFSSISLGDVFDDVEVVLGNSIVDEHIDFRVDVPHSVSGEKSLLTSLFLNLVNNAVKYSKADEKADIEVRSRLVDDEWVEISVTDKGIGIPAAYADKVFFPAQRLQLKSDVEGSGMGLAICKRIINIHEGFISVDKDYTDGARVVVRLFVGKP